MATQQDWQDRMSEDMRLRDFSPKTQEAYGSAVRLFLRWAGQDPELLEEDVVRAYVLHLRGERGQAPSTINIAVCFAVLLRVYSSS
jgi:integrase/recombinase XerD